MSPRVRPLPYIRLVRTMELQSISRRWQRRVLALELYPRCDWGEQPGLSRHRPRSQRGAFAIKLCSPLFGRDGEDRTLTARRPSPGSNRISTPALRISMIGLGSRSGLARSPFGRTTCVCRRCAPRRNLRQSGSKPEALTQLSYTQKVGRPGVIRTLDLTRIRRALFQLSYWSLVIRASLELALRG